MIRKSSAHEHQKIAHAVSDRLNALGYSGFWMNHTNTRGIQKTKKPMITSFIADARLAF